MTAAIAPVWDVPTQRLFFVETFSVGTAPSVFCYHYQSGAFTQAYIDGFSSPSFIFPATCANCKNQFVIGAGNKLLLVYWDGISPVIKVINTLASIDSQRRFGDAGVSPAGRLLGGSMFDALCAANTTSSFYRWDAQKGLTLLLKGIVVPSGVAFNQKERKMYITDACQSLVEFDWDPKTDDICM